jgi:hypothetical protein
MAIERYAKPDERLKRWNWFHGNDSAAKCCREERKPAEIGLQGDACDACADTDAAILKRGGRHSYGARFVAMHANVQHEASSGAATVREPRPIVGRLAFHDAMVIHEVRHIHIECWVRVCADQQHT